MGARRGTMMRVRRAARVHEALACPTDLTCPIEPTVPSGDVSHGENALKPEVASGRMHERPRLRG